MADDAIEAAIQKLMEQRSQIDQAIAALQAVLTGVGIPATASTSSAGGRGAATAGEIGVNRGEFYGLSLTKAAERIVRRANRPMKTEEILAALRRAEFPMSDKHPVANVYTSLKRSKDFLKVLPNTWALAEWHPDAAISEPKPARKTVRRKARRTKAAKPDQHAQNDQPAIKAVS
jgi:hypothetical protein